MPPRKQTSSQKSLTSVVATASSYERKSQPPPILPDSAVDPLWKPSSTPKEIFTEWPNAAALASENWGNEEEPYEDPVSLPTELFASSQDVVWKRPSQFLPAIRESTSHNTASALTPAVPDAKHAATKKPAPAAAKKAESEPPKKPKAPRFAHIVYVPPSETHHPPAPSHQQAHGPSAIDPKKHPGGVATASHPSTPAPAVISPPQPPPRRIIRDFRRLWSDEQQEELRLWKQEEARIEKQKERRESDYLAFEDATAFIINDRPRQPLQEEPVDAEDLEDDGEEDEDEGDQGPPVLDSSPYGGILPPLRVDIPANAIVKPEVPHGKVVHADFASYLRVVDQLYQRWAGETTGVPYLWEAIYPQDAQGVPMYNPAGKYSVKLFVGGKWRRVDVDDKMPVDNENHILVVSSSMKNEIWPAILAKALLKVVTWLGFPSGSTPDKKNEVVRLMSVVITALTGWKVTRHASAALSSSDYQSLQEYIPESHASDAQNELVLEGMEDEPPESTESAETDHSLEKVVEKPKPRAIVCSTAVGGLGDLSFREASLLVDIVADSGNLTIKGNNLNGSTSFAVELLSEEAATFLIVHPPFRFSDLIAETWPVDSIGIASTYPNPVAQFCVINNMRTGHEGEETSAISTPRSDFVDVVFTLTRTPPQSSSTQNTNEAAELAIYLKVDPDGSVILIEDMELEAYRRRLPGVSAAGLPVRRPLVCKVTTASSARIRLPRGEYDSVVFRVYPQQSCRYGYSIQVEADVKVDWQVANLHWRNIWDLQVIEGDGAYPVMLPNSWNILFKQSIELAAPAEEGSPSPELHVDLYLSDPDLAPSVHAYLVSSRADQVIALPGLHDRVVLPDDGLVYTLIVECCPKVAIPEGKWHLTLGSTRFFKQATIQQPRMTVFDGVYEPNKPLLCLRDVVTHPKKTSITSMQFELVKTEATQKDELAAKVEIIDLLSGKLLTEVHGRGMVRVLQLPPTMKADDDLNDEKSGYIIQASIDKAKCNVPDWARSVRPFSYKNSVAEPPKEKAIEEEEETHRPPTAKTPRVSNLKWRLTCWSVDEVKLEFDRAQEQRFDAIRATWAEAAKDRDAHGASSRLLFLGKLDAAQTSMTDDGLSDELMAKYKARVDWLREAPEKVEGVAASQHITVQPEQEPKNESLKSVEDFAREEQQLQAEMDETQAMMQAIREQRAATKEARAAQLKDFVQSVRDQRKEAESVRRALYTQRDEVRAQHHDKVAAGAPA